MIIAVLMAGGKGTRLKCNTEKPIFEFKGKPLIDYVLANLSSSKYIEKVVIAVSHHTPKTKNYIINKFKNNSSEKEFNLKKNIMELNKLKEHIIDSNETKVKNIITDIKLNEICIETPGNGYLEDMSFLLDIFENNNNNDKDILVFINSDLPFVSSEIIDWVLEKYFESEKLAMSVLVPLTTFEEYGIKPSYIFDNLVPSGLNILISQNIIQSEEKLIISKVELALNINNLDDIEVAMKHF